MERGKTVETVLVEGGIALAQGHLGVADNAQQGVIYYRSLMDKLDRLIPELSIGSSPPKYPADSIERVRGFIEYEIDHPTWRKQYNRLIAFPDWELYHDLHEDWKGKSTSEMRHDRQSGAQSFYDNYVLWIKRQAIHDGVLNRNEYKTLVEKLFPPIHANWTRFTTFEEWEAFFKQKGLVGKSVTQIRQLGGEAVRPFRGYYRWIGRQPPAEQEQLKKQSKTLFPEKYKDWSYLNTAEDFRIEYLTNPKMSGLTIGQIVDQFGGYYSRLIRKAREHSLVVGPDGKKKVNKEKRKRFLLEALPHPEESKALRMFRKNIQEWSNDEELKQHPEWLLRSRIEMLDDTKSGAAAFFGELQRWAEIMAIDETGVVDMEEMDRLISVLFPRRRVRRGLIANDRLRKELLVDSQPRAVRLGGNCSFLPPIFRSDALSYTPRLLTAIEVIEKAEASTTFVKGDVLEQLFGLYLAVSNPDALIIPQYCLDVGLNASGKGIFRNRVDWVAQEGDILQFYEVKWGNHVMDMRQTAERHLAALSKRRIADQYNMVRFTYPTYAEANLEGLPGASQINFNDLLDNLQPPEIKDVFTTLSVVLAESAADTNNFLETQFLRTFREALYNLNNHAAALRGQARVDFIQSELTNLAQKAEGYVSDKTHCKFYELEKELQEKRYHELTYSPREAFFHWKGALYRGHIPIPDLIKDDPSYRANYYLGEIGFSSKLDFEIAVMIEMSGNARIGRGARIVNLEGHGRVQKTPIFEVKGYRISSHNHEEVQKVESLEDVKAILGLPDADYRFGLEFIDYEYNSI